MVTIFFSYQYFDCAREYEQHRSLHSSCYYYDRSFLWYETFFWCWKRSYLWITVCSRPRSNAIRCFVFVLRQKANITVYVCVCVLWKEIIERKVGRRARRQRKKEKRLQKKRNEKIYEVRDWRSCWFGNAYPVGVYSCPSFWASTMREKLIASVFATNVSILGEKKKTKERSLESIQKNYDASKKKKTKATANNKKKNNKVG